MRLLTFAHDGAYRLGVETPDGVFDVYGAGEAQHLAPNLGDPAVFFAAGLPALARVADLMARADAGDWLRPAGDVGPCVAPPEKILCVGLNYRQHAEEAGMAIPSTPVLFSKFNNALAGHRMPVPLPADAVEYDYEAELVVVIGRQARNVSEGQALEYVLGYCNGNDLSARDLQFRTGQWLLGKTLDRFMPVGPTLLTAEELPDPQALPIRCWLNGELRQDSTTADMIFSVAEIIAYTSRYMTLQPGDVISTGTPQGVILGKPQPRWLQPGDEVAVEVGGLGRLVNPMQAG